MMKVCGLVEMTLKTRISLYGKVPESQSLTPAGFAVNPTMLEEGRIALSLPWVAKEDLMTSNVTKRFHIFVKKARWPVNRYILLSMMYLIASFI